MKNFFTKTLLTLGLLSQTFSTFAFNSYDDWRNFITRTNFSQPLRKDWKITFEKKINDSNIEIKKVNSWNLINQEIENLQTKNNYKAEEILIISDLDGTITQYPSPANYSDQKLVFNEEHEKYSEKKGLHSNNSIEIINNFVKKGINFIVSSAWSKFDETLLRVEEIGLNPLFFSSSIISGYAEDKSKNNAYQYIRLGNIVSVRKKNDNAKDLYQDKFFSGLALDAVKKNNIKVIVFLDNNENIIKSFKEDALQRNIYPNLEQVKCLHIEENINDQNLKDNSSQKNVLEKLVNPPSAVSSEILQSPSGDTSPSSSASPSSKKSKNNKKKRTKNKKKRNKNKSKKNNKGKNNKKNKRKNKKKNKRKNKNNK